MRIARLFLYLAGVVLLLAGAAKCLSSFGHARILLERDPIVGFEFRTLFWVVGGIEFAVALVCFLSRRIWLSAGLVAWLATSFLAYRFGLWRIGYHKPCSCLGNLTEMLHVSPPAADAAMKVVLAYLLIGSYGLLLWQWRRGKGVESSALSVAPARESGDGGKPETRKKAESRNPKAESGRGGLGEAVGARAGSARGRGAATGSASWLKLRRQAPQPARSCRPAGRNRGDL
ncbi:MAG: hypothetical protein BWY57_02830 [Betaproteobacteria bacterium ADurb.Bin341]|nr:MAG: hypothetical protein BWY57_02830 [Betaproteobacteria bacterium ADurb.Bin341]